MRPANNSDLDDLHDWWNDPEFAGEYAGFFPKTRGQVKQLLKEASNFIIEGRADGRKIGFISYYLVRSDYLNLYETGIGLDRMKEGRGTRRKRQGSWWTTSSQRRT